MAWIRLPVEVLVDEILPNLEVNDLLRLCETQKDLRVLCQDPRIWKSMVLRDFGDKELFVFRSWKEEYMRFYKIQHCTEEYLTEMKTRPHWRIEFRLEDMPSLDIFFQLPELGNDVDYFVSAYEDLQDEEIRER